MASKAKIEPKFESVDCNLFIESPNNPNHMPQHMFSQLVKNLKADGCLTSAVLAIKEGDKYMVISGHHRVAAAKKAGIKDIPTLYFEENQITSSKRIALQISHNSLNGSSEKSALAELIREVEKNDIDYSGIRFELDINKIEGYEPEVPTGEGVELKHISICVRPETLDKFIEFLEGSRQGIIQEDKSYLITGEDWTKLKEVMSKARALGWATPGKVFGNLLTRMQAELESATMES
jgi:hypothetical protein